MDFFNHKNIITIQYLKKGKCWFDRLQKWLQLFLKKACFPHSTHTLDLRFYFIYVIKPQIESIKHVGSGWVIKFLLILQLVMSFSVSLFLLTSEFVLSAHPSRSFWTLTCLHIWRWFQGRFTSFSLGPGALKNGFNAEDRFCFRFVV